MTGLRRRLDRVEEHARPDPDAAERLREEERERIREQAEHANRCKWGEEEGRSPLFEIDEATGDVFCTYDDRPVTDSHQILAEHFYWMEVVWGGPGLVHDEEGEAFYTLGGELAVRRDRCDLRHILNQ